jgi:hypothetical protein
MLPSFLICGAQRCGTTSMYRTLSQHPMVLKARLHKGIHYFDTGYGHSLAWYRGHFPARRLAARVAAETGTAPLTFESSPYYMFHPLAGERIHRDLPGVRLLVLLRDPVERAYSAHAHERARGFETEDFEGAIELEPARLAGESERMTADPRYASHSHQHQAYRTRGQYIDQLERLEKLFGRERIHVVDSGDFFADPEPAYAQVLAFLGLPPHPGTVFERHNARPRAPMADATRMSLGEYFRPYDERLTRWLGWVPSWRR